MLKASLKLFTITLGVIFLFGCASSKDVEMRRYVEIKDRVDQNMEEGNAGFISGTPQPEDRSNIRKTRKIYVLEVSKKSSEDEAVMLEDNSEYEDPYAGDPYGQTDNMIEVSRGSAVQYDDEDVYVEEEYDVTTPGTSQEYTVQKDDTLQKISKKFYDSYSKWPKIYDANRGVIDNPDRIKPGTVIQIPSL